MRVLFQALDSFSCRGLLFRRTAVSKLAYLLRWFLTACTCVLFFVVITLSALAGLFLLGLLFVTSLR